MKKDEEYPATRFSVEVLRTVIAQVIALPRCDADKPEYHSLKVDHDDATWHHDSVDEFFADYRKYNSSAHLYFRAGNSALSFWADRSRATIWAEGPSRADIESIFSTFDSAQISCKVELPLPQKTRPTTFIGRGRSPQWRDLKDHLIDKHGYKIEAYESGARAGHTVSAVGVN